MNNTTQQTISLFLDESIRNMDSALEEYSNHHCEITPAVLSYMLQAYTCVKHLQVLAPMSELEGLDSFIQWFDILNKDFLENVSSQKSLKSTFEYADRVRASYKAL